MNHKLIFGPILIIFLTISTVKCWSGNVCARQKAVYYSERYCHAHFIGCWEFRHRSRVTYTTENYCCHGYTHNGNEVCNIPICSPECKNGGTCIRPFFCSCQDGYVGQTCEGIGSCSHLRPCYPGFCNGNDDCVCSKGFSGSSCTKLRDNAFKPAIVKGNATFAKVFYTQNSRQHFEYLSDATNSTEKDIVWTNQEQFNQMKFDIDAQIDTKFVFGHIPPRPPYIRDQTFGIVEAKVDAEHYKLHQNLTEYLVNRKSFFCPGPSNRQPIAHNELLECRLSNGTNVFQVDSGDRYLLTYTVTTGGFRDLINTDTNVLYERETYHGISSQIQMEYRFDRDVPLHCSEFVSGTTCGSGDIPFVLQQDITMEPLKPRWAGWVDKLSNVSRYSFEVWKMIYSRDYDVLREPEIRQAVNPIPEFIISINATHNREFPMYRPKAPGMYSAILEVVDKANNSRFARRLAIYDNSSKITTQVDFPLFANSASNYTNYTWQTTLNSGSRKDTTIKVSWESHFINLEHEKEHLLKKVDKYTPRLSDGIDRIDYKKIDDKFDDNEGRRTLAAIPNQNSVVKFEYNIGGVSTSIPSVGWVDKGLHQYFTKVLYGESINDGDARQVWIRAYDVVGHTLVDSTIINFDNSPPLIFSSDIQMEKNIQGQNYPFASRITIAARDDHSAIKKVKFMFKVNATSEIKTVQEFMIKPNGLRSCTSSSCYCVTISGQTSCYDLHTTLEINNCWLKVPMDKVDTDSHIIDIVVYNSAMLSTTYSLDLGTVTQYDGIQEYKSPSNVTIQKTLDTSLSISWIQAPTCYERAGILVRLFRPDNSTYDYKVHKEATSFDLTGLQPTTNYWFELYTKYGNDTHNLISSSPFILKFQTAEASAGFPPEGVAGLSMGFIVIIIIVVVVLIFLGRTGRLQPAKAKLIEVRRNFTVRRRFTTSRGLNNRACSNKDEDDIYFYGQMEVKSDNTVLSRKDIAFESELTQGKFAIIYLAKYYGNHRDAQTVVAKVLRDDQNEANIMKMKAKINFYADKVGDHKNVMKFIGSVQDDEARGPFMVLEYCSNGVLRDFLQEKKAAITMDLEERLFRMCFGICLGMDYLASKQVVHRRLAARNILLDHMYEPKITGFGPDPESGMEGDERLPLKWMAPECQKSTKDATELSDVFSYGVVLWEIFSLGEMPYPGIQSRDVWTKQKQAYKMKKPEYCDDAFYNIMLKCWHYEPHKRSGFAQIKEELTNMFQEGPSDDYYYRSTDLELKQNIA